MVLFKHGAGKRSGRIMEGKKHLYPYIFLANRAGPFSLGWQLISKDNTCIFTPLIVPHQDDPLVLR